MIRLPPRSTPLYSSAASDVYKRQASTARVENALRRSTSGGDTPRQLAVVGRRTPGSLHANAVPALWPDASTDESARPSSPSALQSGLARSSTRYTWSSCCLLYTSDAA